MIILLCRSRLYINIMTVHDQLRVTKLYAPKSKLLYRIYCMAGNFRGVLIFVIFVVDLAVTKISTHEN